MINSESTSASKSSMSFEGQSFLVLDEFDASFFVKSKAKTKLTEYN